MSQILTTVCIIPNGVWVESNWSGIHYEQTRLRKLHACLLNIYRYDDHGVPTKISDWEIAKAEYAVNVDLCFDFNSLIGLLSKLVPNESGLFVYSGDACPTHPDYSAKKCKASSGLSYAASCARSLEEISGFKPDPWPFGHFTLGWFPIDDQVANFIQQRWENWPENECAPLLPRNPSPSKRSVELVELGHDVEAICVFLSEYDDQNLSPAYWRKVLGEDAILARMDHKDDDFWDKLENFQLKDFKPIDRDLPF